jgi:hypothetical protein
MAEKAQVYQSTIHVHCTSDALSLCPCNCYDPRLVLHHIEVEHSNAMQKNREAWAGGGEELEQHHHSLSVLTLHHTEEVERSNAEQNRVWEEAPPERQHRRRRRDLTLLLLVCCHAGKRE